MNTRENLIAARALIDTPEKWLQGDYSDSLTGCFCALGAVRKALGESNYEGDFTPEAFTLRAALPSQVANLMVHEFNDHPDTTHPMIMALFDRAIAACEVAA